MQPIQPHQTVLAEPSFAFLTRLLEARGPSGFETGLQQIFRSYVSSFADRVNTDAYGNVWGECGPQDAPAVLIVGHGDEIGLMVQRVEKEGFLRLTPIGGVDPAVLVARRVWVATRDGWRAGVVGALPIHLQDRSESKAPKIWDLYLDLGFKSNDEVAAAGIRVGSWATLQENWMMLSADLITSRALDNRIGVFVAAEALRLVAAEGAGAFRVVAVSTVQEEIGAIGAEMVTRSLQPAAAFVVDVTHATDIPGCNQSRYGAVELGAGPSITHGSANHPRLVELLEEVAGSLNITLQHEASSRYTGTDADNIYRRLKGVPCALLSLPNRYMHTTAETSSLKDLEAMPRILAAASTALRSGHLQNLLD